MRGATLRPGDNYKQCGGSSDGALVWPHLPAQFVLNKTYWAKLKVYLLPQILPAPPRCLLNKARVLAQPLHTLVLSPSLPFTDPPMLTPWVASSPAPHTQSCISLKALFPLPVSNCMNSLHPLYVLKLKVNI